MAKYYKIAFDYESGEGRLPRHLKNQCRRLINTEPLLAADILKDISEEFDALYAEAVEAFEAHLASGAKNGAKH